MTASTAIALENMTLNITQEIRVRASLDVNVRRAAGRNGRTQRRARRQTHADEDRAVAGGKMVSRPGQRRRASLGTRASHQAARRCLKSRVRCSCLIRWSRMYSIV